MFSLFYLISNLIRAIIPNFRIVLEYLSKQALLHDR